MPFTHGRETVLKIDNLANTLTDISTKVTNAELMRDAEILDTTTFQASAKTYILGFKDSKLSFQGHWDPVIDAHLSAILGIGQPTGQPGNEGFDFEYGPEGATTGDTKYTGKGLLLKFQKTSAINGVTGFTAEMQITGDVVRSTYA